MKKQYLSILALIPLLASCGGKEAPVEKLNDVIFKEHTNEVTYSTFIDAYNEKLLNNSVMSNMTKGENSFKVSSSWGQFEERKEKYSEDNTTNMSATWFMNYDLEFDSSNKILRRDYSSLYSYGRGGVNAEDLSFSYRIIPSQIERDEENEQKITVYEKDKGTYYETEVDSFGFYVYEVVQSTFVSDVFIHDELSTTYAVPLNTLKSLDDDEIAEYKFFVDGDVLTIEFKHKYEVEATSIEETMIKQYEITEDTYNFTFSTEYGGVMPHYFFPKETIEYKCKTITHSSVNKADVSLEKENKADFLER